MKNFIKIFGIIAVAAVLCLSVTGCPEDDSDVDINGTWKASTTAAGVTITYTLVAKSSDKTWTDTASISGVEVVFSGTYEVSGNDVTFKITKYTSGGTEASLPAGQNAETKVTVSDNKFTYIGGEYTKQN